MAKITYANKATLNPQPSISVENKVTDADMNEIKTSVNTLYDNQGDLSSLATTNKTSIVNAINELKNAEVYSTTETLTNKVWIDGKPIYRKVITGTTSSTSGTTWNYVNLDTPNINEILPMTTIKYGPSENEINIGNVNDSYGFQYRIVNKNQLMYRQYGYKNIPYTLLLEYTKTTD